MAVICPRPLDCSQTYGTLTVAGWSLHTPAWCAHDLSPLLASSEVRGPNVPVETQPGQQPRPVVAHETDVSLRMLFSGAVDEAGGAYPNPAGGLDTNRRRFTAALISPIRSGTAALTATLTLPDDGIAGPQVYQFPVQPLRLEWELLPNGYARAVLQTRLPQPSPLA